LWAALVLFGLLIAVTTGLLVAQLRISTLRQQDHELGSLALILAEQADRALEAMDIVQGGMLAKLGGDQIRTPAELRQRLFGPAIRDRLNAQVELLPEFDIIAIVDADGRFINTSRLQTLPLNSIADRAYFQQLKNNPHLDSVISDPIRNRNDGGWSLVAAHQVRAPDGTFLGITFAGMQTKFFETLYSKVVSTAAFSVALSRNDGVMVARFPRIEEDIGNPTAEGAAAVLAEDEPSDSSMIVPTIVSMHGEDRLIAGASLAQFPFVVSVSMDLDEALAPWRRQAAYLMGAATLMEGLVAILGMAVSRQLYNQRMLTEARAARAEAEAARRSVEAEVALGQERERADREMRLQHVRLGAALGNMSQALCMFDASNRVVVANRRLGEMLAVPGEDIVAGLTVAGLHTLVEARSKLTAADIDLLLGGLLRMREAGERASEVIEFSDGRSIAMNFAPMEDGGWLATLEDISARRSIEAKIAHMAHHDALTGLPNRVRFHEKLSEAVARSKRGEPCAVMFIDLDHFKAVNDTLGHPVGDALLREVTARLVRQVRETDTVARLGGDEFAIVQANVDRPEWTNLLAQRIIDVVTAPYEIDGHDVRIGTSIGIALAPADGSDPDQLLRNADMALYRAKEAGRGRFRHFESEMDTRLRARRQLELDLRKAIGEGEFKVFYQPLIDLKSRRVCGFEALIRWFHPERGMVSPADFVPVAEETGMIIELGDWTLRQACRDATQWPGTLKVAVNLSPIQLTRRTIVEDVASVLRESGLDPKRLELEITESAMITDTEAVLVLLNQIGDIGVRIALDDFGTGYSSLSYLLRFPFSKLKVDRSFIVGVGDGGDSDAIVAAVITLCHAIGMTITAEGVETMLQLNYIAKRNCTEAQGYLFSKPRPNEDVADMIRQCELVWSTTPA
jgi:diguanylate cyclase (GGDEF)-like protein